MDRSQRRILIVDDEPDLVRSIQLQLELLGYAVDAAYDGQAALDAVASQPPDLVLLDVMMPDMSGLEVLQRLKSAIATKHIPVVILSAATQLVDMEKGWQEGTDLYLTKPIHLVQLTDYIETILSDRA